LSQRFDLYIPGNSWLHRLDPRTKLWAAILAGVVGLLFQQIGVLAALLVLSHLALLSARIPLGRIRWLWLRLAPLLIMILILQPLFAPGPGPDLLRLGPVRITVDGILEGLSFALRAAALAFVAATLLLTTDSNQLVQGLVKLGLPYPWGLTVGLAIRYLPTTYGLYVTISEAQQARGWIVGRGGFLQRTRSYLPILVATIIAALRLSDNLALALAARGLGYPAHRTVLHDIHFNKTDWLAVFAVTCTFGALVALRYGLGWGAEPW
jgi:energy-coupling factor transport system permease protein